MRSAARGRPRATSLRWRLSVSFAGIAVLGALVIGLVLLPILASHYATAARTYLEAAAERAVRDLSTMSWRDRAALRAQAEELALITQARVTLSGPDGRAILDVDASEAVPQSPAPQALPNPLGAGLFGEADTASLARSDQSVSRPVNKPDKAGGGLVGYVRLSEAPAFEQVALLNVAQAWALASLLGVIVAAVVGLLVSDWLSRPLRELTAATDRMANGEHGVRAEVDRSDELGRLAVSFNVMAGRVEDTVASLRRFVADAAHEIGTPLTALQADLDLALDLADTPDERRLLGRALAQAERLGALATGLLRLSRLEAGDTRPAGADLDLASLAAQAVDSFSSRADQAGVDLVFDAPPGRVPVAGDAERLASAIGSLLDNAVKFTPTGGRVEIGVRGDSGVARLWVSDTGIGIPEEDLARLFDRFHRGRNATGYPGSGLGLAIVRATAELHGGSVHATGDGTGARFELRLPLVQVLS